MSFAASTTSVATSAAPTVPLLLSEQSSTNEPLIQPSGRAGVRISGISRKANGAIQYKAHGGRAKLQELFSMYHAVSKQYEERRDNLITCKVLDTDAYEIIENAQALIGRMDHAETADFFDELRGAFLPVEKAAPSQNKVDAKQEANAKTTMYCAMLYHPDGRGYRDERASFSSKKLAQRWLRRKMWEEGWVDPDVEEKKRVKKMNDDDFLMYAHDEHVDFDIFPMELDQEKENEKDDDSDDDDDGEDDSDAEKNASCTKNEQDDEANDAAMKC